MEHTFHLKSMMMATYVMICKIFASSLYGSTLTWFYKLPSGNVDSFPHLAQVFINQFASNIKTRKKAYDIFLVVQKRLNLFEASFNDLAPARLKYLIILRMSPSKHSVKGILYRSNLRKL